MKNPIVTMPAALPHRIAAGAIIHHHGRILLVRYPNAGGSYLVAPGGKVEPGESVADAAVRETLEETGISVAFRKLLFIEDLTCSQYRCCKIWFLCDFRAGEVRATEGAQREGITEARWFASRELKNEIVYPQFLTHHDWTSFACENWQTICDTTRDMHF